MERNIDKLRAARREIQALQERVRNQDRELARVREKSRLELDGVEQVQRTAKALCIAVALKFGTDTGQAVECRIPRPNVARLLEDYRLDAAARGDQYIWKVTCRAGKA